MPVPAGSVIVALDADAHTALGLARSLQGRAEWVKIGMTLYYAEGPQVVAVLKEMGFKVFLDLKLYDIPHQVEGAARQIARLGVSMFTVHASGGAEMMRAAVRGACDVSDECGFDAPDVLAVTVLTSMSGEVMHDLGVSRSLEAQVESLTSLARDSSVQGVVCSPREAASARAILGSEALIVTPGIRPAWASQDDQARIASPEASIAAGATHLVIGRPITGAEEPARAFERIVVEG